MTKPTKKISKRLEYLRGELRGERISYGELAELQSLAPYIAGDDVELREAAGLPEKQPKTPKVSRTLPQLIRRLQKAARENEDIIPGLEEKTTSRAFISGSAFAFRHAVRIVKGEL